MLIFRRHILGWLQWVHTCTVSPDLVCCTHIGGDRCTVDTQASQPKEWDHSAGGRVHSWRCLVKLALAGMQSVSLCPHPTQPTRVR